MAPRPAARSANRFREPRLAILFRGLNTYHVGIGEAVLGPAIAAAPALVISSSNALIRNFQLLPRISAPDRPTLRRLAAETHGRR